MQLSNGAVSSYRLTSEVISATFHTAELRNLTADVGVSYFSGNAETAVSLSVPTTRSLTTTEKLYWVAGRWL
jgi:hypothetical protein